MRTIILAIVTLLSLNISAQDNEKQPVVYVADIQPWYDFFEEELVAPFEDESVYVNRTENNYNKNVKSFSFSIPLMKLPVDEYGYYHEEDSLLLKDYKEWYKKERELYRILDHLKYSASEFYWWEKPDQDSLLISMAWDGTGNHRSFTSDGHRSIYGATYLRVTKNAYNYSNNPYAPRCCINVYFHCTTDTTTVGTEPFDDKAFRKHIAPAFSKKGIERRPFSYHYTKDFLKEETNSWENTAFHLVFGDDSKLADCDINGEMYIIPADIAETINDDFLAAMKSYLKEHPEQGYTKYDKSSDKNNSTNELLFYTSPLPMPADERTSFHVLSERLEDGRLVITLANANGSITLPKEYWNVKSANNDKVKYVKRQKGTAPNASKEDSDEIFDEVQVAPEFPGGLQGLTEYVMRSLRYPVEGIMNDLQAEMLVNFVVEKDGSISSDNIEVSKAKVFFKDAAKGELNQREESNKPIVAAFLNEAKRVVNQMPQWTPGKQNGKAIRTRMSLPVNFHLE